MNERVKSAVEAANRRRSDWQVRELPIPDYQVPGGIYRLANNNSSGLFTLLDVVDMEDCGVFAAMSPCTEYATSWDIVVDAENSPMGTGFMVEIWNRVVVMGESAVDAFFGRLSSPLAAGVGELYIEWLQKGAGNAKKFHRWTGSELNSEHDWRYEFQKQEIERIDELRED